MRIRAWRWLALACLAGCVGDPVPDYYVDGSWTVTSQELRTNSCDSSALLRLGDVEVTQDDEGIGMDFTAGFDNDVAVHLDGTLVGSDLQMSGSFQDTYAVCFLREDIVLDLQATNAHMQGTMTTDITGFGACTGQQCQAKFRVTLEPQ